MLKKATPFLSFDGLSTRHYAGFGEALALV